MTDPTDPTGAAGVSAGSPAVTPPGGLRPEALQARWLPEAMPAPPSGPALAQAQRHLGLLARSEPLCGAGSLVLEGDQVVDMTDGMRVLLGLADGPPPPLPQALGSLAWIPPDQRALVARLWRGAVQGRGFAFEHSLLRADGQRLQVLHRGWLEPEAATDASPHPATPPRRRGVALIQDISERRDAERRVQALASTDELTGLANRAHLLRQADAALHAAQEQGSAVWLTLLSVPRVAELAWTMGVAASDALATTLAARLRHCLGSTALLAHLGGGEFALLQRQAGAPDRERARLQAEAMLQAVRQPVPLALLEVLPLGRVGIAVFPGDADGALGLLDAAQAACARAGDGPALAFAQPANQALARRELQLEAGLRQALNAGELALAWQPQVCLRSGRIVGAEALLRWQSPQFGEVPAETFIPLAERSGQIAAIGDWVLRQCCAQIVRWRAAGVAPLRLAVNLSPVQFQVGDVADSVAALLAETGADAGWLALELTERALGHDRAAVVTALRRLKAMGVAITLDDFGTGASSLWSLRQLPIDLVKVDRAFVSDVTAAPEVASVTRSIIHLAHALQIPVLAEGVETEGQLQMLRAHGCDRMQGWLFSPAVDAAALLQMLQQGRRLPGPPPENRRRTLLLVDDEPNILSALRRLFRQEGCQVLTATSGPEALELLATTPVDVIVSDQRMPGMTGVDFLRRAKLLHPHSVRMTLSGYTDLQSIIDAVNEGAVYKFLTKPWDDERLRAHVAEAFAAKEMADENRRLQAEVAAAHAEQAALNGQLQALLALQQRMLDEQRRVAGG